MACALHCLLDLFSHFLLVMARCRFTPWFQPLWIPWSLAGCGRTKNEAPSPECDNDDPALRPCQTDCLSACAKGARIIEMACGTGKTRVIKELVRNISGKVPCLFMLQFAYVGVDFALANGYCGGVEHAKVLIIVPLRALLDQFAPDFPAFCKVGTGHNQKIDLGAKGFIAVTKSVHLLQSLKFQAISFDEAHHPLPPGMPKHKQLYRFSATHTDEPDFRFTMDGSGH